MCRRKNSTATKRRDPPSSRGSLPIRQSLSAEALLAEQMVVVLVGFLPGLVMRLALFLVGVARLPIMGIGGFGSLVAAATSHRRSGHHGGTARDVGSTLTGVT